MIGCGRNFLGVLFLLVPDVRRSPGFVTLVVTTIEEVEM